MWIKNILKIYKKVLTKGKTYGIIYTDIRNVEKENEKNIGACKIMNAVMNESKKAVNIEKEVKKTTSNVDTKYTTKTEKKEDFFDILEAVNKNSEQVRLMRENSALRLENGRLKYKLSRIERKRQERKRFILKSLEVLFVGAGCLLLGWMLISYINVIANNLTTPENIWDWNFFKVMVHLGELFHK